MNATANIIAASHGEARPIPASLRHALIALASEPGIRDNPDEAVAHVRPIVAAALAEIERKRQTADSDAGFAAETRLTDAAVFGLVHLARAAADPGAYSLVAPITCIAVGNYATRLPQSPRQERLLFLLDENPEVHRRGTRLADFVMGGLTELGIDIATTTGTVSHFGSLADALPAFRSLLDRRRFVCGRHDLAAALSRTVSQREDAPQSKAQAA